MNRSAWVLRQRCSRDRHRLQSRSHWCFGPLVPGAVHKVMHRICGVVHTEMLLPQKNEKLNKSTPKKRKI